MEVEGPGGPAPSPEEAPVDLSTVTLNEPHPVYDQLAREWAAPRAFLAAPTVLVPLVEAREVRSHRRPAGFRGGHRGRPWVLGPRVWTTQDRVVFAVLVGVVVLVDVACILGAAS